MAMAYFTQLYTPETYDAFGQTDQTVTGVRPNQKSMADRLNIGDTLICYMTVFSRWVGALQVVGRPYFDESPILFDGDPFTLRIPVQLICWLDLDKTIPIQEPDLWNKLTFTSDLEPGSTAWTGKVRRSLYMLSDSDGHHLKEMMLKQSTGGCAYHIDPTEFKSSMKQKVRKASGSILVSIPDSSTSPCDANARESKLQTPESLSSHYVQGQIAKIGELTGHQIWIPANDRSRVLEHWQPEPDSLLTTLPLSYDEATIKTVEQIDVLWIRGRSIRRAFEVEHTTAIYSGLLRMADLLALQGNMQIALHIVAPPERRSSVLSQITRPVFSLLENAPLSERCSFLSYDDIDSISQLQHLDRMRDEILDDYAEMAT